jgi:hypothetical protein
MKFKIPYPLVEVIWDDAASNSESWVHINDIVAPERVNTTGFLVKETDEFLTIAASVSAVEDYIETVGNTMTIPKGMIVTRREVRLVNVRKRTSNKLHPKSGAEEVHREPSEG